MTDFIKEDRYIVFKIKDLKAFLSDEQKEQLDAISKTILEARRAQDRPDVDCVVVESDWPIYNQVWGMIKTIEEQRTYDRTNRNGEVRCSFNRCERKECEKHFEQHWNAGRRVSDLRNETCPDEVLGS